MSLVKCLECRLDVSDQASSCLHCGYVIKQPASKDVLINRTPELNIVKVVKTGQTWKMLKVISWIFGILSFSSFFRILFLGWNNMSKNHLYKEPRL